MGDTINIPWANQQYPDTVNAMLKGWQAGREMGLQKSADQARHDLIANPTDMNALTQAAIYDPASATNMMAMQNYQRQLAQMPLRAAAIQAFAMPQSTPGNAFAPVGATQPVSAPTAPQGPITTALPSSGAPASFAQAFPQGANFGSGAAPMAPAGQVPGQAAGQPGQQDGQPQQPMIAHPALQQLGAQVMQGQQPTIQQALSAYASAGGDVDGLVKTLSGMDELRVSRTAEMSKALGAAAQTLLQVPQDQRAAKLQEMMPLLSQHGITPQMVQSYVQNGGLNDTQLLGMVGQDVGTQALITQKNTEFSQGIADRTATVAEQTQAETARHNQFEEGKGVQDGFGNIVNPTTGKVIYSQGGGAVSPEATGYAAALTKAGLPANAVAGIIGNLQQESGFNPGAVGDGGAATGVAQWHPDRAAAFQKQFGVPPSQGTPDQVAQFIKTEISQLPTAQRNAILNAANPAAAAAAFDQYYERSDGKTRDQRMAAATAFAGGGGSGGLTPQAITDAADLALRNGGKVPPGFARNKAAQAAIQNRIASRAAELGLSMDQVVNEGQDTHAAGKVIQSFTSGKDSQTVQAINNVTNHLATLGELTDAQNNGNIPLFNKIANRIAAATGKPAPTNYAAARQIVAGEIVKAIAGAGGALGDRNEAQQTLDNNAAPAQAHGAINVFRTLLGSQLHALELKYNVGTGRDDFQRFLTPLARQSFNVGSPAQSGNGGTVAIGSLKRGSDGVMEWHP